MADHASGFASLEEEERNAGVLRSARRPASADFYNECGAMNTP
ncbi:MAG: hypothetical protein Q8O37_05465 [Sulfuricellaceae bacterium]|nr:hypothetical protein [Sulfuricellaceae bacterium]